MSDAARASDRLHISVSPAIKQVMPEFKISRAVRAGQWLFTNGQMDMGAGGKVLNPGDLMAQTFACMRSVYEVMAKADCRLAELAQLQIFYLATSVADERVYRSEILAEFPECADVLIIMTPVPSFATVGSEVEIDAIAVKGSRAAATDADGAVQAVRRGDWLFASSRAAPGTPICDGLRAALARLDGALGDICRLYAYYPADLPAADRAAIERDLAAAFSIYAASKAAIRSFARNWILDLKASGIRVNVLAPGSTSTPGWHGLAASPEANREIIASVEAATPLGRLGIPEEIAAAALFLASDESSFVNGIELFVDGGMAQV